MRAPLLLLVVVASVACSHVSVTRVTPERPYESGVRDYRPGPDLLVTADRNDAVQAEVIYLPDLSEEYVIEPKVRLGSVEMEATLESGWQLTKLGAGADPEIAATLDAVARLVSAGGALAAAPGGEPSAFPLEPGLYRLVYSGGHVSGVERVALTAP